MSILLPVSSQAVVLASMLRGKRDLQNQQGCVLIVVGMFTITRPVVATNVAENTHGFVWASNSAEECHVHVVEVGGSNPLSPTMIRQQTIDLYERGVITQGEMFVLCLSNGYEPIDELQEEYQKWCESLVNGHVASCIVA